ncbi:MAG: DUF1540 domain-containing protein [Bacillota bacterium]|nr:DUF1540 domain-containing protein [Bacillota bacterium]
MGRITGVKCTVSECAYWGSGNVCEADAIEVNRNPAQRGAARGADMEVGRIGERGEARGRGLSARTSEHTMCKTFRPKPAGYTR